MQKLVIKRRKQRVKQSLGVSKKYNKLDIKATRLQAKADKKKYGLFSNGNKAAELQVKADRARYKANKYKARADKRLYKEKKTAEIEKKAIVKAQKWARSMDKTLGTMKVSELTNEQLRLGRMYLGM